MAMRFRAITYTCNAAETEAAIRLPPPAADGCSIDAAVAAGLRDCCAALQLQDDIRVVTLAGAGPVFATGRCQPSPEAPDAFRVADALAALPMPVVAILNGDALAHGLELALAADLRLAADTARLGAGSLVDDGFPYDGATQRLPRLVGPALARDLLFTGRVLSAAEALDIGLVNRIAPTGDLEAVAADLVAQIAAAAPVAARYAKEAVAAAGDLALCQGLRLEADLSVLLHTTGDRAEGLRAFAEKRPPVFHGN